MAIEPTRNPYSPPETRVVDAEDPARERPLAIKRAVVLLCLDAILSLGYLVVDWRYFSSQMRTSALVIYEMVAFTVMIWLLVKIAAGRNWARITWLILELITWPFSLIELSQTVARSPVVAGIELVLLGVDVAVFYLIFVAGREFFAKAKS